MADLDPADWPAFRAQAHRVLDEAIDYIEHVRDRPVWQAMPPSVRESYRAPSPVLGTSLGEAYEELRRNLVPYVTGNVHPRFMGWVHGGGTPVGMVGEMLAGALNANLGGRDHAAIEMERQVARWAAGWFGFPEGASGLFVTGTSMANFLAVTVARTAALGPDVREHGLGVAGARLVGYASTAVHGCVRQAFELAGLGGEALRRLPVDERQRMDVHALGARIAADRADGRTPFIVVGSAGTVDVGAIDDLAALADTCAAHRVRLHVDGAFGALAILSPALAPRLAGIERADSIAFDFHKWGQVPYDAGFLLVRDAALHRATFAAPAAYLRRETRGLAAGSPWPCDFGPDLSRGFRALKTWLTLRVHGTRAIGEAIERTCRVARHLEARVRAEPALALVAPAQLNIVCFRYQADDATTDALNARIVADLHESGVAAPSTTTVGGRLCIRAAIVNHRTGESDVDALVDAVLALGARQPI